MNKNIFNKEDLNIIRQSDSYIDSDNKCSDYSEGICLSKQEKKCDCCYSESTTIDDQDKKYYILWISTYGEDWEGEQKEISENKEYLEQYKNQYEQDHIRDGKYIPNIWKIRYNIEEYTDKEIRGILTVDEYLELRPELKEIFI